jgi:hypothetical protein
MAFTEWMRSRRGALRRYALVICAFALALLAKPQAITFPFLLCLWDYWPLCRIGAPVTIHEDQSLVRRASFS